MFVSLPLRVLGTGPQDSCFSYRQFLAEPQIQKRSWISCIQRTLSVPNKAWS